MSVPLTINGVTFPFPVQFDKNWGPTVTNWAIAVTNALAPFTGGNASLLSVTSKTTLPATAGFIRLANVTDTIDWRNNTNTANLALGVNSSNQLTFNGNVIGATTSLTDNHIYVGNALNQPADVAMSGDVNIVASGATTIQANAIVDSKVSSTAAIALTKLASTSPYYWFVTNSSGVLSPIGVTASKAVITDSNGLPSASSVTATELGYVSGVTSAIQTQLNGLLPESGGSMSGAINMASNKITSLANGTNPGDAVAFGQLNVGALSTTVSTKLNYYISGASFVSVGAGTSVLIFNSQVFDTLNEYNNSTGIFSPANSGYYNIILNCDVQCSSSTSITLSFYDITGATDIMTMKKSLSGSTDNIAFPLPVVGLVNLSSLHTYEIRATSTSGTTFIIPQGAGGGLPISSSLSIFRVY